MKAALQKGSVVFLGHRRLMPLHQGVRCSKCHPHLVVVENTQNSDCVNLMQNIINKVHRASVSLVNVTPRRYAVEYGRTRESSLRKGRKAACVTARRTPPRRQASLKGAQTEIFVGHQQRTDDVRAATNKLPLQPGCKGQPLFVLSRP